MDWKYLVEVSGTPTPVRGNHLFEFSRAEVPSNVCIM